MSGNGTLATTNGHPRGEIIRTGADTVIDSMEELKAIRSFVQKQLVPKTDFGLIPFCGDKPALFLAGAQKVGSYLNVRPTYSVKETSIVGGHIDVLVKTRLINRATGQEVSQGIGSCSTAETKYRRASGVICPKCNAPAVQRGKDSGHYCSAKKGGCGVNFKEGDPTLNLDKTGSDPLDIYNTLNTVRKMAKKRSFVDSVVTFGCLSELFTADIEDTYSEEDYAAAEQERVQSQSEQAEADATNGKVNFATPRTMIGYETFISSVISAVSGWYTEEFGEGVTPKENDSMVYSRALLDAERKAGRFPEVKKLTVEEIERAAAYAWAKFRTDAEEAIWSFAKKRYSAVKWPKKSASEAAPTSDDVASV